MSTKLTAKPQDIESVKTKNKVPAKPQHALPASQRTPSNAKTPSKSPQSIPFVAMMQNMLDVYLSNPELQKTMDTQFQQLLTNTNKKLTLKPQNGKIDQNKPFSNIQALEQTLSANTGLDCSPHMASSELYDNTCTKSFPQLNRCLDSNSLVAVTERVVNQAKNGRRQDGVSLTEFGEDSVIHQTLQSCFTKKKEIKGSAAVCASTSVSKGVNGLYPTAGRGKEGRGLVSASQNAQNVKGLGMRLLSQSQAKNVHREPGMGTGNLLGVEMTPGVDSRHQRYQGNSKNCKNGKNLKNQKIDQNQSFSEKKEIAEVLESPQTPINHSETVVVEEEEPQDSLTPTPHIEPKTLKNKSSNLSSDFLQSSCLENSRIQSQTGDLEGIIFKNSSFVRLGEYSRQESQSGFSDSLRAVPVPIPVSPNRIQKDDHRLKKGRKAAVVTSQNYTEGPRKLKKGGLGGAVVQSKSKRRVSRLERRSKKYSKTPKRGGRKAVLGKENVLGATGKGPGGGGAENGPENGIGMKRAQSSIDFGNGFGGVVEAPGACSGAPIGRNDGLLTQNLPKNDSGCNVKIESDTPEYLVFDLNNSALGTDMSKSVVSRTRNLTNFRKKPEDNMFKTHDYESSYKLKEDNFGAPLSERSRRSRESSIRKLKSPIRLNETKPKRSAKNSTISSKYSSNRRREASRTKHGHKRKPQRLENAKIERRSSKPRKIIKKQKRAEDTKRGALKGKQSTKPQIPKPSKSRSRLQVDQNPKKVEKEQKRQFLQKGSGTGGGKYKHPADNTSARSYRSLTPPANLKRSESRKSKNSSKKDQISDLAKFSGEDNIRRWRSKGVKSGYLLKDYVDTYDEIKALEKSFRQKKELERAKLFGSVRASDRASSCSRRSLDIPKTALNDENEAEKGGAVGAVVGASSGKRRRSSCKKGEIGGSGGGRVTRNASVEQFEGVEAEIKNQAFGEKNGLNEVSEVVEDNSKACKGVQAAGDVELTENAEISQRENNLKIEENRVKKMLLEAKLAQEKLARDLQTLKQQQNQLKTDQEALKAKTQKLDQDKAAFETYKQSETQRLTKESQKLTKKLQEAQNTHKKNSKKAEENFAKKVEEIRSLNNTKISELQSIINGLQKTSETKRREMEASLYNLKEKESQALTTIEELQRILSQKDKEIVKLSTPIKLAENLKNSLKLKNSSDAQNKTLNYSSPNFILSMEDFNKLKNSINNFPRSSGKQIAEFLKSESSQIQANPGGRGGKNGRGKLNGAKGFNSRAFSISDIIEGTEIGGGGIGLENGHQRSLEVGGESVDTLAVTNDGVECPMNSEQVPIDTENIKKGRLSSGLKDVVQRVSGTKATPKRFGESGIGGSKGRIGPGIERGFKMVKIGQIESHEVSERRKGIERAPGYADDRMKSGRGVDRRDLGVEDEIENVSYCEEIETLRLLSSKITPSSVDLEEESSLRAQEPIENVKIGKSSKIPKNPKTLKKAPELTSEDTLEANDHPETDLNLPEDSLQVIEDEEKAPFKLNIDPEMYDFSANQYFQEYTEQKETTPRLLETKNLNQEGTKILKIFDNGKRQLHLENGAIKEIFDNLYCVVTFPNGDVKQTLPDKSVIYYFAESDVTEISLPKTGMKIYKFKTNQVEFHHADGLIEIK